MVKTTLGNVGNWEVIFRVYMQALLSMLMIVRVYSGTVRRQSRVRYGVCDWVNRWPGAFDPMRPP